jgi:glycosyltransferase involved in cell wall biosynthesis
MGLRFAMVTTFYPPYNFGGDGLLVQRLARALVRRGHHVTVIHDADAYRILSGGRDPDDPPHDDGVEIVTLRSRLGALSPLLTQQLGTPVANGRRIRRVLDDGRYDVINFHNVSLVGGPGVLALGEGVKLYTAHEHWLVCPTHVLWRHRREPCTGRQCLRCQLRYRRPPQLWRSTGLLERRLRHVDAIIALSEFSREKHREFGLRRSMEVVPGFLPPEDDAAVSGPPPHARPYFLFVGRLTSIKGLHDVLPLFHEHAAADLVVVGTGEDAAALRAGARGSTAVRFVGPVSPVALEPYYRHALALIVPSVGYETFGSVVIEAFRAGTPVIARRIGALPEIVSQAGGGELFTGPEELAACVRRLASDAAYRDRLGQAARAGFARYWTEDAVIPRYLDVVRRAAEARGLTHVASALRAEAA